MTGNAPSPRSRFAGGLMLWFATLGGAVAWSLHLVAAWGADELVCASGHSDVAGTPLTVVLTLAIAVPAAVTLAALAVAWLARRRISQAHQKTPPDGRERRLARADLMAVVGLWANSLFLAIIALGGAALLVFPPCQR